IVAGRLDREYLRTPLSVPSVRSQINQRQPPRCRRWMGVARKIRNSAARGPLVPLRQEIRGHADSGARLAIFSNVSACGALSGPLRRDRGHPLVGRSSTTLVVLLTPTE